MRVPTARTIRPGSSGKWCGGDLRQLDLPDATMRFAGCRRPDGETVKWSREELHGDGWAAQGVAAEANEAVIDGGYPEDEPVGQRWGKVEPALWRRRRTHSPTAPSCLRMARYGRTVRDLRRTGGVCGWHRVSGPISASEMASEALSVVGRLRSALSAVKATRPSNRRPEWVGEGGRRRWSGRNGEPDE